MTFCLASRSTRSRDTRLHGLVAFVRNLAFGVLDSEDCTVLCSNSEIGKIPPRKRNESITTV
jgi:hypothetical protein